MNLEDKLDDDARKEIKDAERRSRREKTKWGSLLEGRENGDEDSEEN
jgi:hypothetical protein